MALPSTKLVLAILVCLLTKIVLAAYLPLVNDEAYAIAVSKEFSLSFFDHPPIGFWSTLFFTKLLGLKSYFLFRLPYLLFSLGTTLVLFQLGKELGNCSIGLWTALIYNITPFFLASGGFLVVPDGPLNLGIATTALCVIRLHKEVSRQDDFFLILLGISLAWSFASKYQGFLVGLGCLLVLLGSPKRKEFLKKPSFYLCLFIATLGLIPTLLWNSQNQWISFQFHGARQGDGIDLVNFTQMFFGLMIYLLPPIVFIPITHMIFSFRKNTLVYEKILLIMAMPTIMIFTFVFLFSAKAFPHWIIPGWLLLLPIAAKILSISKYRFQRISFGISILMIWPLLGILILHSQTGFLTNHMKTIPSWDNTLELLDWQPLRKPLQKIINDHTIQHEKPKLAALTWMEAGQLSTVMNSRYETLVIEGDPHHFYFLENSKSSSPTFLVKINLGITTDTEATLKRIQMHDETATHVEDVILTRGSRDYATASIYLLKL